MVLCKSMEGHCYLVRNWTECYKQRRLKKQVEWCYHRPFISRMAMKMRCTLKWTVTQNQNLSQMRLIIVFLQMNS